MNVRTSKGVPDRQKVCAFVHSVFLLQGPKVAAELVELFHPEASSPKGDADEASEMGGPGFLSVILGFGRALKQRLSRLIAADEKHYKEKAVYSALLKKRDSLTRELTQLVVALRRIVLGEHVQPHMDQLGFEGETAREAVPLLRQADRIVKVFATGEIGELLGPPNFEDSTFEPKGRGNQVKKKAKQLHRVVAPVGDAKRRTEDAYLAKQGSTKEYDQLFTRAGRIFEDCCRVVGREELADRIRPSEKRPGRTQKAPPGNGEEGAGEAAEAADPAAEPRVADDGDVTAPAVVETAAADSDEAVAGGEDASG